MTEIDPRIVPVSDDISDMAVLAFRTPKTPTPAARLVGYVAVQLPGNGIILDRIPVYSQNGIVTVASVMQPSVDVHGQVNCLSDGKWVQRPVISFSGTNSRAAFSASVAAAIRAQYPGVLEGGGKS